MQKFAGNQAKYRPQNVDEGVEEEKEVTQAAAPAAPPPPGKASLATHLGGWDRAIIVIGFVLTTAVTSVVAFVTQDRTAECQAIRSQRIADVDRFRSVAVEFEPLVADYMGKALHGGDVTASKKAVLSNLREQRSRLQYVVPYLDASGKVTAKRFDDAAVNFVVEAEKNPTGVAVGPLYKELAYIVGNSQDLVAATNRATGLSNIEITSGKFWRRTINCAETS